LKAQTVDFGRPSIGSNPGSEENGISETGRPENGRPNLKKNRFPGMLISGLPFSLYTPTLAGSRVLKEMNPCK